MFHFWRKCPAEGKLFVFIFWKLGREVVFHLLLVKKNCFSEASQDAKFCMVITECCVILFLIKRQQTPWSLGVLVPWNICFIDYLKRTEIISNLENKRSLKCYWILEKTRTLVYMSVLCILPVPYFFDYWTFPVYLKKGSLMPPALFLFSIVWLFGMSCSSI